MRYDKYEPKGGGYRAPLAADFPSNKLGVALGVGHDSSGNVVLGAGASGIKGVLVLTKVRKAGEIVDVMTDGEIVEAGLAAGSNYYAAIADGAISTTTTDTPVYVGHTVEASRLIVRVAR